MPRLLGITYAKSKALPKIFQACLIDGMGNKNHMGVKLEQEAKRLGLKPVQVAAVFNVKPPSVYDWYEHGRIHKKHYPRLVEPVLPALMPLCAGCVALAWFWRGV